MLNNINNTLRRLKWLFLIIALLYGASIALGLITRCAGGEAIVSFVERGDQDKAAALEKIFGGFREPVSDGHLGIIALCSLIVFALNMFGNVTSFTLPGILILPIALTLVVGGWMQGISLGGIQASLSLSLFLFLSMGCLEWVTYVIASVAGVNVGLSVLVPKRHGVTSRWKAFRLAWRDAGRLYIIIVIILAFQAVSEILYVRKVLLMGGSAIPLAPY
ncbi:MAG: hypothetical protein ACYTBJ_03700 [Planctomycetota bacterium]|jgi:hypothetical protein